MGISLMFFNTLCYCQTITDVATIEIDQGLKTRTVNHVIRDDNGFFILLLDDYIQKFDGNKFESIDISVFRKYKFRITDVTKVSKLSNGDIYFNIPNSDVLFYIIKGANKVLATALKGSNIITDGNQYLLSGEQKSGYKIYDIDSENENEKKLITNNRLHESINTIVKINATIYLEGHSQKIYTINKNDILDTLSLHGKILKRNGALYIFNKEKIFKLKEDKVNLIHQVSKEFENFSILKKDTKGNILIVYPQNERYQEKLYLLDKDDNIHDMSQLVKVNQVFKDFYTDDGFHKWMLVGYNGIHVVSLNRKGISIINKNLTRKKQEFGNIISNVACDNNDKIIFAKESIGFFQCDTKPPFFHKLFEEQKEKGEFYNNAKIRYDSANDMFYCNSYKSDIYKFGLHSSQRKHAIAPFKLNDIYLIEENKLLIGGLDKKTSKGRLSIFDFKKNEFEYIKINIPPVRCLMKDNSTNTYWVGTNSGIYVLDMDYNILTVIDKNTPEPSQILYDHIIMIHRYKNHMMFGSIGGGVYAIDPKSYVLKKNINTKNGLSDNSVIGFISDDIGHLWVTTFNGVNILDSTLTVIKTIHDYDGLPHREFNAQAIAKDSKGNIYAGTLNGLGVFSPKDIMTWENTFKINISKITAHNGLTTKIIPIKDDISLLGSYDSLIINYNHADYFQTNVYEKIITKLSTDKAIKYKDANKKLILYDLKPSDINIQLTTNKKIEKEISIQITKDYSYIIRVILAILIIGLLFGLLSRFIINRNKVSEKEKTMLYKKISDLQLSSLQSQMNPHFIFNALGSVQYFIQTHKTDKADEYLSNFAMLMRKILDSSKSKFITLGDELTLIKLYLGLEKVRFEELFDYKITIDNDVDEETYIPPMLLQPYIENSINHGFYNLKGKKGVLNINISSPNERTIIISIKDNGIGRKKAASLRLKHHKSRGMQIIKERMDTFNATENISIDTKLTDLGTDDNPEGTLVKIKIISKID
ncbi:MAG: histidine kinase [Saprospiraceae bacterium]